MKFLCGSCRTKYQISDEKVRGKILTIRCKKCGAKILVRESLTRGETEGTVVAPVADEPAASPPARQSPLSHAFNRALSNHETHDIPVQDEARPAAVAFEWYTAIDGQQYGPFSFEQVQQQIQRGQLIGRHYVWHDGMESWTRIRDQSQLQALLPAASAPPPPPPPAEPAMPASELPTTATATTLFSDDLAEGASETQVTAQDPAASPLLPPEAESDIELNVDSEDLFASVPRATEADLVAKESTRFFVKAAGVKGTKSKNRMATLLGGALMVLLALFVGAWAGGIIKVEIPGIGNPFARDSAEAELYDGEADDPNSVKGLVGGPGRTQKKSSRSKTRRRPAEGASRVVGELGNFEYVDGPEGTEGLRGRSGEGLEDGFEIGPLTTNGAAGGPSIVDADLPGADVSDIPEVDSRTLSPEAVQRTVNSRKRSVKICYEQSLRGQDSLRGKLEVAVTIAPSGKVQRAEVQTSAFKGSRIGTCIAEKIREWRFPSFTGEPEVILVPFILERSGY